MRAIFIKAVGLVTLTAGLLFSANTPAIGVAITSDSLLINDAQAAGNATIFSGSTLQSGSTPAEVRMKDGAEVSLQRDSRGKLFSDHIDLEKGSARVSGYSINANGLKIDAQGASSASVSMHGKTLEVASISGNVHVFNASGVTVANLLPGRALNLTPQEAGAAAPSQLVGCVAKSGNNFFLTDETSNVTVQLRGGTLRANRRFQVNGNMVPNATAASPATQVVNVVGQKDLNKACNGSAVLAAGGTAAAGGAAAGAAAAGAAAGAAGAAGAATAAVVAGVAAAAAVGTAAGVAATSGGSTPQAGSATSVTISGGNTP